MYLLSARKPPRALTTVWENLKQGGRQTGIFINGGGVEHIRGLESVARVHQGESGVQVLLCLSAGRDVRERDREQPCAQDGGVQSAGEAQEGQKLQDSFREGGLHVLHIGFSAG